MAGARRVIAALALAALCAPGTWLRSPVETRPHKQVDVIRIAGPAATDKSAWALVGVWHYRGTGLDVGGFSAMVTLGSNTLRAFTDRGFRMTFREPDLPNPRGKINRQLVEPGLENDLFDIESATRNPDNGDYWLGFENVHTIQRYTVASSTTGVRSLMDKVDWSDNGGIEAMVRLADGRFVIMPETGSTGLIFPGDPVEGSAPATFTFRFPSKRYVATDTVQLPDGRLLVLLRKLVWPSGDAWPPFSALLAIGDPPRPGKTFAPVPALWLDGLLPRENYEGLALRPRADGRVDVWVMADDNLSLFQRTLLAKLVFDPKR